MLRSLTDWCLRSHRTRSKTRRVARTAHKPARRTVRLACEPLEARDVPSAVSLTEIINNPPLPSLSYQNAPLPVGWGYMDPMVVRTGGHVYAPEYYPYADYAQISPYNAYYVLQTTKDGQPFGNSYVMGTSLQAGGTEAYQPPMVFAHNGNLIVAYWEMLPSGGGVVKFVNFNMTPDPNGNYWSNFATYQDPAAPGDDFNYLGGAANWNSDSIYIAGCETDATNSWLKLVQFDVGAGTFQTQTLMGPLPEPYFKAVYPQVAIDPANGNVNVLATLGNSVQNTNYYSGMNIAH
jgi:hypothetical protein